MTDMLKRQNWKDSYWEMKNIGFEEMEETGKITTFGEM